jgi:indolepyruvate ferredoxin oxidoreductase
MTLATQLYRVMAYKDEYEVARMLASTTFGKSIEREFGKGCRWRSGTAQIQRHAVDVMQ